ncbi:unnamed protein product [Closterium sp. NIES-65]|nr:unnamed protein product [Closterium sp. NIES-65]
MPLISLLPSLFSFLFFLSSSCSPTSPPNFSHPSFPSSSRAFPATPILLLPISLTHSPPVHSSRSPRHTCGSGRHSTTLNHTNSSTMPTSTHASTAATGADGEGRVEGEQGAEQRAWEWMCEEVARKPGQISIIQLGPMTNLARCPPSPPPPRFPPPSALPPPSLLPALLPPGPLASPLTSIRAGGHLGGGGFILRPLAPPTAGPHLPPSPHQALSHRPSLASEVAGIWVVGGSFFASGDVNAAAEESVSAGGKGYWGEWGVAGGRCSEGGKKGKGDGIARYYSNYACIFISSLETSQKSLALPLPLPLSPNSNYA